MFGATVFIHSLSNEKKSMKSAYLLVAVLFLCNSLSAQEKLVSKNRLTTSVYRLEPMVETLNDVRVPKFFNGIFYERSLSKKFSGIAGIEYGEHIVKDECDNCTDFFEGEGKLKDFNLSLGSKYHLLAPGNIMQPFLQGDLYYGRSRYKENFSGGINGQPLTLDKQYSKYGFAGRAGFDITIAHHVVISPITAFKIGRIRERNNRTAPRTTDLGWIPFELRLGVDF